MAENKITYDDLCASWVEKMFALNRYQRTIRDEAYELWKIIATKLGVFDKTTRLLNGKTWPVLALTNDAGELLGFPRHKADPESGVLKANITLVLQHPSLKGSEGMVSIPVAFRLHEGQFQVCIWNNIEDRPSSSFDYSSHMLAAAGAIIAQFKKYLDSNVFSGSDEDTANEAPYSGTHTGFTRER